MQIEATFGARVKAKVGVGGSRETETRGALETAFKGLLSRLDGAPPTLIVCAFTCTHDADELAARLHELAPTVPMIGCTTCRGVVLNDTWLTHKKEFALGLWGASRVHILFLMAFPPRVRPPQVCSDVRNLAHRHHVL